MPAVQTSYADKMSVAYNGMVADSRFPTEIISREVEDATLAIGIAVIQGTADAQVKIGAAGVYIGVTIKDVTLPPDATNQDKYLQKQTAAIITRGAVWVVAPATVAAGNPVYRTAAGVLTPTSAGNTLVANAMFETSGASSDLVRVGLR